MNTTIYNEELADEGIGAGVLTEDDLEELSPKEPFDPEKISISSKVIALDTVLRRIKNRTIRLSPDFQRGFVWDKKRKSQLIESMILKIPLPMFYVAEDSSGVWEVVDGLQRLSTIRDYIIGPDEDGKGDKLQGLEFLGNDLDGKTFFALEKADNGARIVNNIMESELSFTIINPDTPEKVKRNIFKRINTGGMRLSDQEIRHALYQGQSTKLLNRLVKSESYIKGTQNTVNDARMAGRELVLRFLAFSILGRKHFTSSMDTFLSDTMIIINDGTHKSYQDVTFDIDHITRKFDLGITRALLLFERHAFRNSTESDKKKAPINKSLFEVWINLLSNLDDNTFRKLLFSKKQFMEEYRSLLINQDFSDSISRRGGSQSGSIDRHKKLDALVNRFIEARE